MRNLATRFLLATVVLCLFVRGKNQARAESVFSDNFNKEPSGLNYSSFQYWTVSNGTVDVLPATFFGLPSSHGQVVDLDGSSFQAGLMTSQPLVLSPGSYTLSFDLAGSQRGDVNIVDVSAGITSSPSLFFAATYTLNSSDPFTTKTATLNVATATSDAHLFFHNRGSDNNGAKLDNVILDTTSAVPEPSTLVMGGIAALVGLGLARRRLLRPVA